MDIRRDHKWNKGSFIISVINSFGVVERRLVSSREIDSSRELLNIFDLLNRDVSLLANGGCVIFENYNIFNQSNSKDCKTLIEFISGRVKLYVFGAGHVGMAVAQLGVIAGYDVIVLDDREDFLQRVRGYSINAIEIDFFHLSIEIDVNSVVVIVTRGHQFDEICLKYNLSNDLKYLGMIGSKRRVLSIYKRLEAQGVSPELFSKVYSPIGLKLNAKTPVEIGISIIAEIISVLNK